MPVAAMRNVATFQRTKRKRRYAGCVIEKADGSRATRVAAARLAVPHRAR
jgi:hypothetical protein